MKIIYVLLLLLLPLIYSIEGGKLMDKVFTKCSANGKHPNHGGIAKANMETKSNILDRQELLLDENTKIRETIAKAEANLNTHYFQGDMMLTHRQQKILDKAFKFANVRTDIENRAMIKDMSRLWPDGQVAYTFKSDVDEEGKKVANDAMKHWMDRTCLKFKQRTTENDFVEFQFGDGCASRVGRLGGMQEILIGSKSLKCKVGNLIHELGHTLGFFHEHSRPDRDQFVQIAWDLVRPGFEINFKKLPADLIDSRDVSYDYGSIMHYPRTIFGKLPWSETVILSDQTQQVGQRIQLSPSDILQAKKLYGCAGVVSSKKHIKRTRRVNGDIVTH